MQPCRFILPGAALAMAASLMLPATALRKNTRHRVGQAARRVRNHKFNGSIRVGPLRPRGCRKHEAAGHRQSGAEQDKTTWLHGNISRRNSNF